MCLEDLKIARRKYFSVAPLLTDGNASRRKGSVSTIVGPLLNHGEATMFLGPNTDRTAIRVALTPDMVFNDEDNHWQILPSLLWGFPVTNGEQSVFDISGPIYPWIMLSTTTKLADTITIEDAGTLIYGPWAFITFSDQVGGGAQLMSAIDIMADRVVMAGVQGDLVNLGG